MILLQRDGSQWRREVRLWYHHLLNQHHFLYNGAKPQVSLSSLYVLHLTVQKLRRGEGVESLLRLSVCPGFVWMISSEPINVLYPNLVCWCMTTSRSAMRCYPHCKGHREDSNNNNNNNNDNNNNKAVSIISSEFLTLLQPNLVLWYSAISRSVAK